MLDSEVVYGSCARNKAYGVLRTIEYFQKKSFRGMSHSEYDEFMRELDMIVGSIDLTSLEMYIKWLEKDQEKQRLEINKLNYEWPTCPHCKKES